MLRHRLAAAAGLCAAIALHAPTAHAQSAATAEVRAFMDAYARDLRAGNREAIAARYDRAGAYRMGNGHKALVPYDSIRARYRTGWGPPHDFAWDDLSFEVVGPDAVVVAGRFRWTIAPGASPMRFSYTALLRKRDGAWRIRLEDESADPATLPKPPARDTARR
jgi:hypothetical protein